MDRQPGRIALLAVLLGGLPAAPCWALFDSKELDKIDAEVLMDSEYFLDLRSFSYPNDWLWGWERNPQGWRINSASLDANDLWIEQEVRLGKSLNDWFSFSYALDHLGDKESDSVHQWINLEFGPWLGFTYGIFGEPAFDKEDADLGFSLKYGPKRGWTLFSRINFVDWNFNERGKTTARYARKPLTVDGGIQWELAGQYVRATVEVDTPLIREIPAENRIYNYRRTVARISWNKPPGGDSESDEGWGWRASYVYDYKREQDAFAPDPANITVNFHRKVHELLFAAVKPISGSTNLELGSGLMIRGGQTDYRSSPGASIRQRRWEALPFGRLRRKFRPWALAEVAAFMSLGERNRVFPSDTAISDNEQVVEAKLGTGVDFLFGKRGKLGLYATFDLDEFDRHFWDGGNIRAMFLF